MLTTVWDWPALLSLLRDLTSRAFALGVAIGIAGTGLWFSARRWSAAITEMAHHHADEVKILSEIRDAVKSADDAARNREARAS